MANMSGDHSLETSVLEEVGKNKTKKENYLKLMSFENVKICFIENYYE
jgi:hypothetical protein